MIVTLKAVCLLNMNFFPQLCYTSGLLWTTQVCLRLLGLKIHLLLYSLASADIFQASPNLAAVGVAMWLSQCCLSAGALSSIWAKNLSRAWFPLAFPICTWMDWTVRKEEPAKRRSLGAWMTVRREPIPKPNWIPNPKLDCAARQKQTWESSHWKCGAIYYSIEPTLTITAGSKQKS